MHGYLLDLANPSGKRDRTVPQALTFVLTVLEFSSNSPRKTPLIFIDKATTCCFALQAVSGVAFLARHGHSDSRKACVSMWGSKVSIDLIIGSMMI